MAITIDFDADVAQAVTDLAGSFTWSGTAYAAVVDPISAGERMDGIEGIYPAVNFMIVVQTSLLTSGRPVTGSQVIVGGTTYRVTRVDTDEADAALNLFIEEFTA